MKSSNIISIYLIVVYLLPFSMVRAEEKKTSLELDQNCIVAVSRNSISFQATASNGKIYKSGLSCFSSDQNSAGYSKGELRVLKSEYHVGAHTVFPYSDCMTMKKSLEDGNIKIMLSWDQKAFDDFVSGKLNYQISDEINHF